MIMKLTIDQNTRETRIFKMKNLLSTSTLKINNIHTRLKMFGR